MGDQFSLFEPTDNFSRGQLAASLAALAQRRVFIGTSSWRYEGWLGQIYSPDRYRVNGRFSKTKFNAECVKEYADVFPIVGADFSFYAIQPPEFWTRLFSTAPVHLKWSLKVPETFTAKRFSKQERYGALRGQANPEYLNADLFQVGVLDPLAPFAERIAVLMFEFGTFSREAYDEPQAFFRNLDAFLARLPRSFRYGVEIRNTEFLQDAYFRVLRSHGVAHVLNSWTRMPSLSEQLRINDSFTAPFTVVRGLLRPGRPYQEAVNRFVPYAQIKEEYPAGREGFRSIIQHALQRDIDAYIHVNNRLEGNAPETIRAVVNA